MSTSFSKLATVTASTQREGAVSGGLAGDLATNIASLSCTPIDPLTPEVAQMAGLGTWAELLQTMVQGGLDIQAGDRFIVGSDTYKVKAVAEWKWEPDSSDNALVILEETK